MVSLAVTASILGYVGGSILAIQLVPQIIKVWRSYSAKDISFATLCLNIVGGSMVAVYGILIQQPPVYATVLCSISCNIVLLSSKIILQYKNKTGSDNFHPIYPVPSSRSSPITPPV